MPVRKPVSVKEKPIKSFDEITPEFLAEKEKTWEDVRMKELTLASMKKAGEKYNQTKSDLEKSQFDCQMRAIKAFHLGYDKKELAEAFGVTVHTINKWTKDKK